MLKVLLAAIGFIVMATAMIVILSVAFKHDSRTPEEVAARYLQARYETLDLGELLELVKPGDVSEISAAQRGDEGLGLETILGLETENDPIISFENLAYETVIWGDTAVVRVTAEGMVKEVDRQGNVKVTELSSSDYSYMQERDVGLVKSDHADEPELWMYLEENPLPASINLRTDDIEALLAVRQRIMDDPSLNRDIEIIKIRANPFKFLGDRQEASLPDHPLPVI